jgi:hypothetical protein
MGLLDFLINNALSVWIRESTSVFGYPTVIALHTFGMAFLVGTSAAVALRMIGFARSLPLASLSGVFRLTWFGFWINVITGLLLLAQDAQRFLTMPKFYIKMLAIVVAIVLVRSLQNAIRARTGLSSDAAPTAAESARSYALLGTWLVAVTVGRLTGYSDWVGVQTAGAVLIVTVGLLVAGYVFVRAWPAPRPAATKSPKRRTGVAA